MITVTKEKHSYYTYDVIIINFIFKKIRIVLGKFSTQLNEYRKIYIKRAFKVPIYVCKGKYKKGIQIIFFNKFGIGIREN